ncbi:MULTISPECIES: thioredoxin family protein [unclassified Nocardioides]|uniref:thioredoxin family protein n=1 Tax=unclassified Nocardioides TaxID=2615069 RepID=UPI00115030A3|nr:MULTISPECIES: thioredoxin family protein [unclassified Nocardioides]TQK69447.1 thiol-disulfide isomerase/thioredoxin [Nocardioides sp. SLBN-35]WGY01254.1 thioredoxin family protein [Nocardioides sp. QY071]
MNPGLVLLLAAVVVAVGFGLYRRRTDGTFATPAVEEAAQRPSRDPEPTAWSAVAASVPAAELGERATLLQFSSAFCAPCRTTRVVLSDVAGKLDGVAHVEIDAEEHLDLVRALDVRRTPTTLVLDRFGHEITRAAGAPRREQVLAALPTLQGA